MLLEAENYIHGFGTLRTFLCRYSSIDFIDLKKYNMTRVVRKVFLYFIYPSSFS